MKRKARKKKSARRARPAHLRNAVKAARRSPAPVDHVEALMSAGAAALGIAIDPAWRDGVAFNLRLMLKLAAALEAFPLPDETEPAPVFNA